MSDVAELTKKSRSKPRNNLKSFDTEQIKAELFAIESEAFSSSPNKEMRSTLAVVEPTAVTEPVEVIADKTHKATDLNPIGFSADNSRLLHRAVRNNQNVKLVSSNKNFNKATEPDEQPSKPTPKAKVNIKTPTPVRVSTQKNGMDGFNSPRATGPASGIQIEAVRPLNSSSVALKGLQHANEFNSYAQRTYKTSMHSQIENKSLFQNSFNNKPEVFDHGARDIDSKRRYNKLKRTHKMLGGVDQHNLGAGPLRQALTGRTVKLLTPVFVLLMIGGLMMYNNAPEISLKFAENKSGISVNQPSYTPDGFRLDRSIDAETGKVAMSFVKDNSSYDVIQSVSDWDSKALLENKVAKESTEYSAYTDRGLTIYVYNGKAVWVNQGKINEIDTLSSGLEIEEMVRIAGSM